MAIGQQLYGGTPVVLEGNTDVVFLSSAARTASVQSTDRQAYFARGLYVYVVVTSVTDTPSIVVKIQGEMPNGDYIDILESDPITTTGTYVLLLHPSAGAAAGDITQVVNYPLPLNFRISVEHGDTDSITYYSVEGTVII